MRYSGGLWLRLSGKNILIDPGPASLIRIFEFKKDPRELNGIVLSHRHLDHVADIASVVESATESNTHKLDFLLAPEDAIGGEDPVVLKYTKRGFRNIWQTDLGREYIYEDIKIKAVIEHIHKGAKTFSLEFSCGSKRFIFVPCGKFYEDMLYAYDKNPDIMVFNTTFPKPNTNYYHLSALDVEKIIDNVKPKKAVITHYSLAMLKEGPDKIANLLSDRTKTEVIAAKDGLRVEF